MTEVRGLLSMKRHGHDTRLEEMVGSRPSFPGTVEGGSGEKNE